MKSFIIRMLEDERGSVSSKRTIAFIGSAFMFLSLIFHLSPTSDVVTGCVTIICICLGATTVDKFSVKG